jgi:hypothetical protein
MSRRSALAAGAGIGGLAIVSAAAPAAAQDATPDTEGVTPSYLFVQSFDSGSLTPIEGENGRFVLELHGEHGRTIGFADRPERLVGSTPTEVFLAGLGFEAENAPNAALVFEPSPGETDIIVLELLNPRYDKGNQTLIYDVALLDSFSAQSGLTFQEAPRPPDPAGEEFGLAQLFIDSDDDVCGNIDHCINPNNNYVNDFPGGPVDLCETSPFHCNVCDGRSLEQLAQVCNSAYRFCENNCIVG